VRHRFPEVAEEASARHAGSRAATFELSEFLVRVLGRTELGARFPHKVALLQSCHGLRDLGLGHGGEEGPDAPRRESPASILLRQVEGLELVEPERPGECCGFGGTFAVKLPEISARMGRDRLEELARTGAEFVTSTDASCLIHLEGLRRRTGIGPRAIHLAEILASLEPS
jgi:L-lactate dehydrogenase complex protein LldE